jgi:hypothetical protein
VGAAWQTEPWGEGMASRIETRGGKKIRLAAELAAKHKVRGEWATLCKRKLTSFEDFSAGGFYLFGFCLFVSFILSFSFLSSCSSSSFSSSSSSSCSSSSSSSSTKYYLISVGTFIC